MALSSCSKYLSTALPSVLIRRRTRPSPLKILAQSYESHEGRGGHIGDMNLKVLKERIEEVRVRERLERCLESEFGWNYNIAIDEECKNYSKKEVAMAIFALLQIGGTIGLTILACSSCLCLTSIFIHFIR